MTNSEIAKGVVCEHCREGDPFWEDGLHKGDHSVPGFLPTDTNTWNTCKANVYPDRVEAIKRALDAKDREREQAVFDTVRYAREEMEKRAQDQSNSEISVHEAARIVWETESEHYHGLPPKAKLAAGEHLGVIVKALHDAQDQSNSEPVAWRVVCADGVAGTDHLIGLPSKQRAKMLFFSEWEARDHARYADDCSECGPHRVEPLFAQRSESEPSSEQALREALDRLDSFRLEMFCNLNEEDDAEIEAAIKTIRAAFTTEDPNAK
jgi:hypothetical protein